MIAVRVTLQVMAPLPVAKGEMSPCPLPVDSLCRSCAVICSYKDLTKEVSIAFGRSMPRFSTNWNQHWGTKIYSRGVIVSFYTMGKIWSLWILTWSWSKSSLSSACIHHLLLNVGFLGCNPLGRLEVWLKLKVFCFPQCWEGFGEFLCWIFCSITLIV